VKEVIGQFRPRRCNGETADERLSKTHERPMSNPIAFVLLDRPFRLDVRPLVEILRQRHADLRWDVTATAATAKDVDPPFIRCGDHLVTILSMPAPLPYDENLWKRASKTWPEAPHIAARHSGHLIVTTMGAAENKAGIANLTPLESARLTTAVVGGLTAITSGCCGVVWAGNVARSPQIWLDMSRRAFAPFPDYPFTLWVEIIPFPSARTTGAITVGLSSFLDREIEFEVDGMEYATVIDRVAGLAVYLIERGTVVKDGDTIGVSEQDRIKVYHRTSRFTGAPVIAVGFDRPATEHWPQYPIIPASIARDHPLLIMLRKVGLFDPSSPENQIKVRPDGSASSVRLESYDQGMNGVFSKILVSDAYAEADEKARGALASGDVETAKAVLMPFAKEVSEFQAIARVALTNGDLFMFQPR
jgi:hypothetical protein